MEQKILSEVVDDWFQLWELAATEEGTSEASIEAAREAVKHLLGLGLAELARWTWPKDDYRSVDASVLDDRAEWEHQRETFVVVGATVAGTNLYHGQ